LICVIDNYDSFVYNLVQYAGMLGHDCRVFRHDAVTVDEIEQLGPDHVFISPGPADPVHAGISVEVVRRLGGRIPLFGYAWAINASARHSVRTSCTRGGRCTAVLDGAPRRQRGVRRAARSGRGDPVPLAGHRRGQPAGRAGGDGLDHGGRNHGGTPPELPIEGFSSIRSRCSPTTA